MNNKNSNNELPTMAKLIKSTIIAISIATTLLFTAVLPAEYGIDPTGIGKFIGLLKMGEIKVSLAQEAAVEKAIPLDQKLVSTNDLKTETESIKPVADKKIKNEEITITLKPNEGKEIKVAMEKGGTISYLWKTNGARVNFDTHADSEKLRIKYHPYGKGTTNREEGILVAAFDGKHGWFWRNRTNQTLTVSLKISGNYSGIN